MKLRHDLELLAAGAVGFVAGLERSPLYGVAAAIGAVRLVHLVHTWTGGLILTGEPLPEARGGPSSRS